jgi:hypothetical protein
MVALGGALGAETNDDEAAAFVGGGIAGEIAARHGHSAQPESRQVMAVLGALVDAIAVEGLVPSPTSFFAAGFAALEKPETRSSPQVGVICPRTVLTFFKGSYCMCMRCRVVRTVSASMAWQSLPGGRHEWQFVPSPIVYLLHFSTKLSASRLCASVPSLTVPWHDLPRSHKRC